MKYLLSILIVLFFVGCDSYLNSSSREDSEVNKICDTFSQASAEYIQKDCRKGEIFTVTVVDFALKIPQDINAISHNHERLNTVVARFCDFSKQIVIKEVPTDREDNANIYDLTCVYSGGYKIETTKGMETVKDNDPLGLFKEE